MNTEFVHDSELNLELQLMTEVMGLESLHYGYWDEAPIELDLEGVKRGQKNYTISLQQLLPDDVTKILDVGCGIGDNARFLANKGYKVTAISPDLNHGKFFDSKSDNPQFCQSTIEDLDIADTFDLILMSESQNYFGIEDGLKQARSYLQPGGYLLISGNFAKNGTDVYPTMHSEPIYHKKSEEFGFHLVERIDITNNILPTLEYTRDTINNSLKPIIEVMSTYFERQMPIRTKLAKFLLGGQIKEIDGILSYYDHFLDRDNYTKHVNYVRLLYQLQN